MLCFAFVELVLSNATLFHVLIQVNLGSLDFFLAFFCYTKQDGNALMILLVSTNHVPTCITCKFKRLARVQQVVLHLGPSLKQLFR